MKVAAEDAGETTLTAQQMLERCMVPIKAEYLIHKTPAAKQGETTSTPIAAESAPAEPSTTATTGQKQDRDQEQNKSKSRKQMRKDFRASRQAEICTNQALGRCAFGERCKFSHDLVEFAKTKPADLPGICPWTSVRAMCPYGITCRYARSHGSDDELHRTLAAAGEAAEPAEASAEELCVLPPPTSIEGETNVLSKDVQMQLWKNRYDFSRSDSILKSMDLRISFKHQPKPLPGDGGRGGGGGGDGGRNGGGGGGSSGRGAGGKKGGRGAGRPVGAAGAANTKPEQQLMQEQNQQLPFPDGEGEAAVKLEAASKAVVEMVEVDIKIEPGAAMEVDAGAGAGATAQAAPEPEGPSDNGPAVKRQRLGDVAGGPPVATAPAASDAAVVAALQAEERELDKAAAQAARAAAGRSPEAVSEARAAHVEVPVRPCERRRVDFRGKTYLAPLTTVGNLPFRRVCKALGVEVTCGEMALATNLLQGQASEWALMKRHPCEDLFGVQVCGGYPDALARVGQLLGEQLQVDFVDINMGCPIDLVCDKNAGSALLRQPRRIEQILRATSAALGDTPLTFKTRKGFNDGEDVAHTFLHKAGEWGATAVTLHGRTRQQRYSRLADWDYIQKCGESCAAAGLQLIGNGDVFSFLDWNRQIEGAGGHLAALMIGRGALIKPWIFTEIKEQRHWDISAGERLDLYKQFCSAGLEHWGSDSRGVETTRRFLLEWLSFTCRYVPVGLLEVVPQQMNHRPPTFRGRTDLETLLGSEEPQDWIRISEMLLGPPPAPISFTAKHKSNSYAAPGAGSELDMARG